MIALDLDYTIETPMAFEEVVKKLQEQVAEHQFRVLAVHDVQETLAEKGLERDPLQIIEVCNAKFAHKALQKDIKVAMFMPCRYTIYTENGKTIISLARPSMIAEMLPEAGLNDLAGEVEETLRKIMEATVK